MKVFPVVARTSFGGLNTKDKRKPLFNPTIATGYTAFGMGLVSGVCAVRKNSMAHKLTAMIALAAATAHVLLLKSMHGITKDRSVGK